MSNVLIITGMHRSGTSLIARYLHDSGLFIGNDLLGKHESNPAGHYEDRDFLAFHNLLLSEHRVDHKVSEQINWQFGASTEQKAIDLITKRNKYDQWGWKDPRTCLFLPFWKCMLPKAHFLIVYRQFQGVVRSLIVRDIQLFRSETNRLQRINENPFGPDKIPALCDQYLRMWIWYNNEIINNLLKDGLVSHCLVPFDKLTLGDFTVLQTLNNKGFHLHPPKRFDIRLSKTRSNTRFHLTFEEELLQKASEIHEYFLNLTTRA